MTGDRGSNGGASGPADPVFVRKLGWENATAIAESRATCWDFME